MLTGAKKCGTIQQKLQTLRPMMAALMSRRTRFAEEGPTGGLGGTHSSWKRATSVIRSILVAACHVLDVTRIPGQTESPAKRPGGCRARECILYEAKQWYSGRPLAVSLLKENAECCRFRAACSSGELFTGLLALPRC